MVRDGEVVGLLCLRHVREMSAEERETTSVQGAMAQVSGEITITPGEPLVAAMAKMSAARVGRLLVVEGSRLVGLVTMNSILRQIRVREDLVRR